MNILEYRKDALYHCFINIYNHFINSDLPVILLRPKKIDRKECFKGDYDFLYKKSALQNILASIHGICKDEGIHFKVNQKSLNKCLIILFFDSDSDKIIMELWPHTELKVNRIYSNSTYISSEKIFNSKLLKQNKEALLSLLYITHLYHKNKNIKTKENIWRFKVFETSLSNTSDGLSNRLIELLYKISTGSISLKGANQISLSILKDEGIKPKISGGLHLSHLFKRVVRKIKFTPSKVVPMIGPDGCGKGTIQETASKIGSGNFKVFRFKNLFRVYPVYNIRYRFFKNFREVEMNRLDESMVHYIYWMSLISFPFFMTINRGQIIMDRYFTDYLATPIRYLPDSKTINKIKFYRLYLALIPTPKKLIILGCKDESLKQRKNELETTAVRKLEELVYEFIVKKKVHSSVFLSTERPPEETARIMLANLKI